MEGIPPVATGAVELERSLLVLGPEAPLMALAGGVAVFLVQLSRRAPRGGPETAATEPSAEASTAEAGRRDESPH